MLLAELQSDLAAIEQNTALREEHNFAGRAAALDTLEAILTDGIPQIVPHRSPALTALQTTAETLQHQFLRIDAGLFERLRSEQIIGTAFKSLLSRYAGTGRKRTEQAGYDVLDRFVNGLLLTDTIPAETIEREPEMVFYQQTPARVALAMVEQARFTEADVFYDLGAGLGLVPMLVSLLSPAWAKGVEVEPAFCAYAHARAAALRLERVTFIHADARNADYADGTVFFLYTPFEGQILQQVLHKLHHEARTRTITLFTYGPCTATVSQQSWLMQPDERATHGHRLARFQSCVS
jgi:SAM-dependent methyltransferase